MNSNRWYDIRDKRTDSCNHVNDSYKNAVVHLVVTDDPRDYRVQLMVHFSLLMLARWCRNIVLYMEDAVCQLPGKPGSFQGFIKREIEGADPCCGLTFNAVQGEPTITLFVGVPRESWPGDYVSIGCSGWMANVGFNRPCGAPTNAEPESFFGAVFAACLGNAEMFRCVTGRPPRPYRKWYSLWTNQVYEVPVNDGYGPVVGTVDLGRVHVIGCGSIGSTFVYLVPYLKAGAEWLLVDPDKVEGHNTSSSLLFSQEDARAGVTKVDRCRKYLHNHDIPATGFEDDYKDYRYSHQEKGLGTADIILCFANENNIWGTIQHLYPPVCFHATTSKSWGVHIGRHIPLVENCLMCTFQDVLPVAFVPRCAEVQLPLGGPIVDCAKGVLVVQEPTPGSQESHTAILPFLAPVAALMTLAELVKTLLPGGPARDNTTEFNLSTSQGAFISMYQSFGHCHICANQHELYGRFGPLGKHWRMSLSPTEPRVHIIK